MKNIPEKITQQRLSAMELHEEINLEEWIRIVKVNFGWVYIFGSYHTGNETAVFVSEFNKIIS